MKKYFFNTFSLSLLSILLISCGGTNNQNSTNLENFQPHTPSKLNHFYSKKSFEDWTYDVGMKEIIGTKQSDLKIYTDFWSGIPDSAVNYQYFFDTDNNPDTGFSASNGWEIIGADLLIENGKVFKSKSTTKWRWKYIGRFKSFDKPNISGLGSHERGVLYNYKPKNRYKNIFPHDKFKAMLEVYNKNWIGNFDTITDIDVEVKNINKSFEEIVRDKIMQQHGASRYIVTEVYIISSENKEAIVMEFVRGVRKMAIYDISNLENTIKLKNIANNYNGKFLLGTISIEDDIVRFQIKDDDGNIYKITYNYVDDIELSKEKLK